MRLLARRLEVMTSGSVHPAPGSSWASVDCSLGPGLVGDSGWADRNTGQAFDPSLEEILATLTHIPLDEENHSALPPKSAAFAVKGSNLLAGALLIRLRPWP